ncbi:phage tail tape measure protein [Stutzerimonas frequens]
MASRSLGQLTIDLVARTGGFVAGMDKAERSSEKWRRQVEKSAAAAGAAIGAVTAVAAGAMAVWVKSSINSAAEIENLARLAGSSTTEFQKFAAGARTVGIENDKLSDILKDVNDKVGDFLVTGGGPLKDFFEQVAPKVGVTADQFRNLSGPQALGLYVDTLEKAGANQQEMTFFLEAIASDATMLAPLLRNGAQEMRGLADEAENLGLILSEETIAGAKQFNDDLDLLGRVAGGVGQEIAADLLPHLLELTDTLRDPKTIEAAKSLASGLVTAFNSVISGAEKMVSFIKWASEEVAVMMGGIGLHDIERLEEEATRLQTLLNKMEQRGETGYAIYGSTRDSFDKIRAQLDQAYDLADLASNLGSGSTAAPVVSDRKSAGLNIDLGSGSAERAKESSKAAAEAAREAEKALRAQQAAIDAVNEAQERTNQEAIAILDSLMSEEEQIKQSYERRRQIIMDATLLTEQEKNEAILALQQEHDEAMIEANGSFWERYLLAAEESLVSFDDLAGSLVENFASRMGDAFADVVFEAESAGDAAKQMAEQLARSVVSALAEMAAQWLAYQAVQLLVGKTTQASAATTMIANASAASMLAGINAFASTAAIPYVGPLAAPGAMAAALAATTPLVGAIASVSLAGMAHDGIDSVPATGTWLLEKGERVTTAETSAKLDKTLSDIQSGGAGAPVVNLYEDASKAGTVNNRRENGQEVIDIFVSDIMSDGKSQQAISRKFGIQGVGQ